MASGVGVCIADVDTLQIDDGGSVISSDGEIFEGIKCRIAKTSHVFGCLKYSIFANVSLLLEGLCSNKFILSLQVVSACKPRCFCGVFGGGSV